jgi:hypothetical protein
MGIDSTRTKEDNSNQENQEPISPGSDIEQVHSKTHCTYTSNNEKHWLDYAIFAAALVAAIGGIAAASFTGWQAWIAEDTAKRQLRGYLIIGSNDIPKLAEGIQPFVKVTIQNMGQTPTYDGAWISGVNVLDYPLRQTIVNDDCINVMKDPTAPKWMIGKSSDMEKWRDIPFQASEVKAIHDGKSAIYFHGRICYRDIFKEVRHTEKKTVSGTVFEHLMGVA